MKQLNSHDFEHTYKALGINLDTLGCVMADVEPLEDMKKPIRGTESIYYTSPNPNRKWINGWIAGNVAHVTLLYGLLENAHTWEQHVKAVMDGWVMETVQIDHVGYFESPYPDEEYYCIVAHIKVTPELQEGHDRLQFLPHINTFSSYKPHMTICYIEKNAQKRDDLIKYFNYLWAGKKLRVKPELNLGYLPKGVK